MTDYDGSTLDYAYDAAGRVTSMNDYFSHATTYTYTDTGQVSTITAPGSKTWTYAYNALGQPTSVSIPNGMTTEYGYDTRNRLTKIEHKDGANVLDGFTYALDDGGNITRTTQADSSLWDYEYDGRDRLTKAERYDTDGTTLLHRYSYTYDDGDNLLTKLVYDGANTVTTSYAVNNANEMTSMSVGGTTTTMAYDAWGRMTSKTDGTYTAAYAYRYGDKLGSVTSDFPGEGTVNYEYGGDQKRRERDVSGGGYTWYNWDVGWNVINEEHANGTLARTYLGRNQAHVDGTSPSTGAWKYYTHDNLGSSRGIWNENKTEYATFEYTPYGEVYASSGTVSEIPHRYTGHDWDATSQLYFAPFRYYMPDAGRWTTRDPLGMVDGPNVYGYGRGNPVVFADPSGRFGVMATCCIAWGLFMAWDMYDALTDPLACNGLSGADWTKCMVGEIIKKIGGEDSCVKAALVTSESLQEALDGVAKCFKCDMVNAFRDTGKALSFICCLGKILMKIRLPKPNPNLPPVLNPA